MDPFMRRETVITFATDVATSNRMCNIAWERGHIVQENIIDGKKDGIDRLLKVVAREEITSVYIEGLYEICRTFKLGAEVLTEIRRHNIKVVMPEWELDPMYSSFEAAIEVLNDLAKQDSKKRSEAIKTGQRYSREKYGRKCGRPRRKLPVKEIAELRAKGLAWTRISKELDIPVMTMVDRKEDIELYIKDWGLNDKV